LHFGLFYFFFEFIAWQRILWLNNKQTPDQTGSYRQKDIFYFTNQLSRRGTLADGIMALMPDGGGDEK
jgi:hypothetical protein